MKETSEIYAEMKGELERRTGLDVVDGGDMGLRLSAVAAQLSTLWAQLDWTRRQSFPQSASGESLGLHAFSRGLTRIPGTRAKGLLCFETDVARETDLLIPVGTVCLNAGGREFMTTEEGRIQAGALLCLVPAEAREAGAGGNVPARSLCYMALAPTGVSRCYNPDPFSGGGEPEGDEALRERVLDSYMSLPNGSNSAYYEAAALNTEGVGAVCVLPRERGRGTVDLVVAGVSGLPSEALVQELQARFEQEREICVDVLVSAPSVLTVNLSFSLTVREGEDFEVVANRVREALSRYFDGRLLGRNLLLARLGYVILGVPGVENYKLLLPAADMPVDKRSLPVLGSVSISRG